MKTTQKNISEKISASKRFLEKVIDNMDNLHIANSGGKDSTVVYFLLQEMGVKLPVFHSNTTIDPDGTLKHIREVMPDTVIINPKESFYQLVERKGFPTRLNRYCCQILKENGGIGKNTIEGVRASESRKRANRDYIQCDTRKSMKGAKHIYPILDWTDDDVWGFIESRNLPVAPCYHLGMSRLGCVACPLVSRKGVREQELKLYPRRYDAYMRAITKGMSNNPQWKLSQLTQGNGEIAMSWWLSGKTMNEYFKL